MIPIFCQSLVLFFEYFGWSEFFQNVKLQEWKEEKKLIFWHFSPMFIHHSFFFFEDSEANSIFRMMILRREWMK